MKAVVFEDVQSVSVTDVPDPRIEDPGDAVVRITAAGICGTDLHFYNGKAPLSPGDTIGHEGVGVVDEVGPNVRRFRVGDRVVMAFDVVCGDCWFCLKGQTSLCEDFRTLGAGPLGGALGGAQAELIRVPNADINLMAIPEGLDDERALFVGDILTTGYYGAAVSGIRPGDTVAVIGAGPVGFFVAQAAALHGPERVFVLDVEPDRLALAESVGAVPVNVTEQNPRTALAERTGGRGADVAIEAVGSVPAVESAVDVVRSGGTVCVVGMFVVEQLQVPLGLYWARMLQLRFAGVCPVHAWWERSMAAVVEGGIDPLPIISHRLPLSDAPKGYELFDSRRATKVVLAP